MLTREQCRAARALLGWTQKDLETATSLHVVTIRNFENGREMRESNQKLLRMAFEKAGVILLDANGEGPGARLSKAAMNKGTVSDK